MRRVRAMAAWLAVLVAAAAPAGRPPAPTVAAAAARLDELTRELTGNVVELRASERLDYRRIEGGIAACMRAHGHPYRIPPYVDVYRDFTDADRGYGNGHATIIDSLTAGTRVIELNARAGRRIPASGVGPRDADAYNGCAAPYGYRSYHDVEAPAGAYELATFDDLLTSAGHDPAVVAAWGRYDGCMRGRYGYTVGPDRSDFLFSPPLTGAPGSTAWRRGVARMRAVFAADADCRRPAYEAAMRVVARELGGWERRHHDDVERVRRAWRDRVIAAAVLSSGRSPRPGP